MNIEAMARAAFEALHAHHARPRDWALHPDEDAGTEMGRDTFRRMAAASAGATTLPEPVAEPALDQWRTRNVVAAGAPYWLAAEPAPQLEATPHDG